jgi:hypothetical protein
MVFEASREGWSTHTILDIAQTVLDSEPYSADVSLESGRSDISEQTTAA